MAVLTNPVWVVKTRLQLQREARRALSLSSSSAPTQPYRGFFDCLRRVALEEGPAGLYAGLGPSLALVTHGALQFACYERLRAAAVSGWDFSSRNSDSGAQLSGPQAALCGAGSKLVASLATYPVQVVRSRLQQLGGGGAGKGGMALLRAMLATEGVGGLYQGITPHLLRVMPASALTLLVYETVRSALGGLSRPHSA